MSTVYDRGTRDKEYCTSAEVTNVSVIHQCSIKLLFSDPNLLHLSITLVLPLLTRTHTISTQFTARKLLNQNVPAPPPPSPYHVPINNCLETPKSQYSTSPPLPPHYSHIISPRITAPLQAFENWEHLSDWFTAFFSLNLESTGCSKSKALGNSLITTFQPPYMISPLITKMKMFQPFLPYHIPIHKTA